MQNLQKRMHKFGVESVKGASFCLFAQFIFAESQQYVTLSFLKHLYDSIKQTFMICYDLQCFVANLVCQHSIANKMAFRNSAPPPARNGFITDSN